MANPEWTDPEDWEDKCWNCGGKGFVQNHYLMRPARCDFCQPSPPASDRDRDPEGDETHSGSVERSEIEPGPSGIAQTTPHWRT